MNIIDIVVILFILMCMVSGFKRGFVKETINIVGNFLILVLAFLLMENVAQIFYKFFPFLNLEILGVSLSALNILVYQILAFSIIYLLLSILLKTILSITKIVDKLLNSLIIFHTTSSILGSIVGFLSGYITVFVILLVLSIPFAGNNIFHNSKINSLILNKTPILTNLTSDITNATNDIYKLAQTISKDENKVKNSNKYNLEVMDIMLKYKVISINTVNDLKERQKLSDIKNLDIIINKYK